MLFVHVPRANKKHELEELLSFILYVEGPVWRLDKLKNVKFGCECCDIMWTRWNTSKMVLCEWNEIMEYSICSLLFVNIYTCENFSNVLVARETPLDYFQEFLVSFITLTYFFNTFKISYLFKPNRRSLCMHFVYFVCALESLKFMSFWHLKWFRSLLIGFVF